MTTKNYNNKKLYRCNNCGDIFERKLNADYHKDICSKKPFNDKEVQLDMAFHDALTAIQNLEKWLGSDADAHITITKMSNTIRVLEHRARKQHTKPELHPVFEKLLKPYRV